MGVEYFQKLFDQTLKTDLLSLDKSDFAKKLRVKHFRKLLENNIINLNWVPIVLDTEDDIEFATRKQQIVMMDPQSRSLSVLSLPYHVPAGVRFALDLWALDGDQVLPHLYAQLENARKYLAYFETAKYLFISVMLHPGLTESFISCSQKIGLDQFKYVRGSQGRDLGKMYIYEKSVSI